MCMHARAPGDWRSCSFESWGGRLWTSRVLRWRTGARQARFFFSSVETHSFPSRSFWRVKWIFFHLLGLDLPVSVQNVELLSWTRISRPDRPNAQVERVSTLQACRRQGGAVHWGGGRAPSGQVHLKGWKGATFSSGPLPGLGCDPWQSMLILCYWKFETCSSFQRLRCCLIVLECIQCFGTTFYTC